MLVSNIHLIIIVLFLIDHTQGSEAANGGSEEGEASGGGPAANLTAYGSSEEGRASKGGQTANLSANGSSKEGGASEGGLMANLNTQDASRKRAGNGGCAELGMQRPHF